ncbi:MAG: aspartate kinase [Anaerolineae bacterium]|jgi:aspartate kinase|nr:aspartate kinase [Anaerolineae bacterium]
MIVHKFGGTSVGNAARFATVADIVNARHVAGAGTPQAGSVVVVSAMSGVTNQLLAGAWAAAEGRDSECRRIKAELVDRHLKVLEALLTASGERLELEGWIEDRLYELERLYRSIGVLGELTARGRDHVAAFGEQLSVHILAAALRERGVRSRALLATDLIVTDDAFGAAVPMMDRTREALQAKVKPLVTQGTIPVITGFIAATETGITTTLGRGGSDYTAAIVGAGLDADEVWIWSDVNGILTADPNLVPRARTLRELSYTEASDLAYYGADVLHPKTIRPVIEANIPLRIMNSFDSADPGTLIVRAPAADRERLPAIISTTGLSLIAIGSADDSWSLPIVARALQSLSEAGIDVLMFSQSFSEHSLNLIVRRQDQQRCLKTLRVAFAAELHRGAYILGAKEQVATVSVVGVPGWNGKSVVSHAFSALGAQGTRVIAVAQAATEHSVSFCIPEEQVGDTVRFLHRDLGLEE